MKVSIDELNKTSHIRYQKLDDRCIPLHACFNDDNEWELWLPSPKGLVRTKAKIIEGSYFAKEPVSDDDGFLAFNNFMLKRAFFNDVVEFVHGIVDDFHNLGASIDKINLFHHIWQRDKNLISRRYVSTELEYIFSTCRSIFDLLQEIISRIWKRAKYLDGSKKVKRLKKSFAKMILNGERRIDIKEIEKTYSIPYDLARFYHAQCDFFYWLREYRNYIDHSGKGFELIFITEHGFAVSTEQKPFSSMDIWNEKNTIPNKVGSVRSVAAYITHSTLKALEDFTHVISSIMVMPFDIAPDYLVFEKGPHIKTLRDSYDYINKTPWIENKRPN